MNQPVNKNKKRGIEITRSKVGEADNFQCLEYEEDYDIELAPQGCYEDDVNGQINDIR